MSEELTVYQQHFIEMGFMYRNRWLEDKDAFWKAVKSSDSMLTVLTGTYVALAQIKQIPTLPELIKDNPDTFKKYDAWARKFLNTTNEDKITRMIKALIAFKFLTEN